MDCVSVRGGVVGSRETAVLNVAAVLDDSVAWCHGKDAAGAEAGGAVSRAHPVLAAALRRGVAGAGLEAAAAMTIRR